MDSDEEYEPNEILRGRCRCKREHRNQIVNALQCKCRRFGYYVKWVEYDADKSTWKTAGNIASHPGAMRAWKKKKKALDEGQLKQKMQRQSDQISDNNKQKKKEKGTEAAADPNPVATEPTVCVLLPGQAWSNCCGAALPETSLDKQKNCEDRTEGSGCSERKAKLGKQKRKPASRQIPTATAGSILEWRRDRESCIKETAPAQNITSVCFLCVTKWQLATTRRTARGVDNHNDVQVMQLVFVRQYDSSLENKQM